MEYNVEALSDSELEHLVNSLVVPRPIAWLSTLNSDGVGNLAPFSYFNVVSSSPPILMVSFSPKGKKDSLANIRETGEFVVNVATHHLRHTMVVSAADVDDTVDEADLLGLPTAASVVVAPPRLAGASAAMECRVHDVIPVFGSTLVLGEVVHVHVDDEVIRDGRVVAELLCPVSRLGGSLYTTVTSTYKIARPAETDPETLREFASRDETAARTVAEPTDAVGSAGD
jgi:flavin reductase (DIM6/NTAB) family NADH-FMN oxidoreductase RutF